MLESLGRSLTLRPQAGALGTAHLIHRLVQMAHDMETIQHMQRLSNFGSQNSQVGLPHVATHKTDPLDQLWPEHLQAPSQSGLRAPPPYPQQASALGVDLVDHGQKVIRSQPPPPMNLVYANRFDTLQLAVSQTPLHKPLHRPIHRFPTGVEGPCRFPPAEPACPAR